MIFFPSYFTLDKIVESKVRRAGGVEPLRSVNHLHSEKNLATRVVVGRGIRISESCVLVVVGGEIVGIRPPGGDFVQAVICLTLNGNSFGSSNRCSESAIMLKMVEDDCDMY